MHPRALAAGTLTQYITYCHLTADILFFLLMLWLSLSVFCSSFAKNYAVTELVDALRYKPEGRGFESRRVIEISRILKPSCSTMTLGSTEALTQMSI